MKSGFDAAEAARFVSEHRDVHEDVALRTYTARLLGRSPALVLHGGGNTSVKTTAKTRLGESVAVLCVKGSGWDLATIEPAGHPACRIEHLKKMLAAREMSDVDMVNELRLSLLDAGAPTPSVEALLHASLPAKYIDHTHADAVLAVADQPDAEKICREIWGDDLLFVPYVMPGFVLAKRCDELFKKAVAEGRKPRVMVLERHGIFTWGDTAQESYDAMIAAVTKAESYAGENANTAEAPPAVRDTALTVRLLPILRGVLAKAHGLAEESGLVCDVRATELGFLERADIRTLVAKGCATPDHVIRTKPTALFFAPHPHADDASLTAALEKAVKEYAAEYDAYFETNAKRAAANGEKKTKLDSFPRVFLVPKVGIISFAKTKKEAAIAADIYEHTREVMTNASSVGTYSPVSMADLFDVEYWSLEQAKIKKTPSPPLGGRVALVTGAASGIGLATCEVFLAEGAHVVLVDREASALSTEVARLAKKYGPAVTSAVCDVTSATEVRATFEHAVLTFGGIDVVVSNAGNAPEGLLHTNEGEKKLRDSIELNLLAHNTVAMEAVMVMRLSARGGALVFNASKSSFNQGPGFGPYAVAKSALVSLVRQYAVDLGGASIRANAVNADRIRTGLFGGGVLESRAKARGLTPDEYFRSNLLHREVLGEDVARAFLYLATARATTGCVITVDGGNAAAFPR
jgi:rhamnose utilization protein RhaD (predicted bifunctional aldolase and dehydrogenase)/NAD(P)-dependent dehydrogenase (short-subunit alcohol dehydrogenase family)